MSPDQIVALVLALTGPPATDPLFEVIAAGGGRSALSRLRRRPADRREGREADSRRCCIAAPITYKSSRSGEP